MKSNILNFLLILSSFFGYLEWGIDNSSFLFEVEYQVISGLFTDFNSVSHPFTLLPLLGQILLVITLFQKQPSKKLTYLGIVLLGLLFGLMLFISIINLNFKILLSVIPFFIITFLIIRNQRKK
ncbi:hypothetical protein [Winogradskyella tangerina]|uniref:hypothetical protein n=1 Tax=Winogradskyella tangerina TaxID=2023240 RepID=UPI000DBE1D0D|nr:hypothetical protein [Winogradskyella tangerina]